MAVYRVYTEKKPAYPPWEANALLHEIRHILLIQSVTGGAAPEPV